MSAQDDPFDGFPPVQPNPAPGSEPALQPGYQPSSGVGTARSVGAGAGAAPAAPTGADVGAYQQASAYSPYSYGGYGSGAYGSAYGSAYGGYPSYSGYSQYGGYGGYGGLSQFGGVGAFGGVGGGAAGARHGVAAVAGGVQDAMARFARISAAVDNTLRSLHMLFDALFGIGIAAGALAREARVIFRAKAGPAAFIARLLRRIARLWRLLVVAVASPIHSPFGVVLGALGISPPTPPPPSATTTAIEHEDPPPPPPPTSSTPAPELQIQNQAFDAVYDASNL